MSEPNDWAKREIVKTATLVITGELDLVRGCRKLSQLSGSIHPLNGNIFNTIIGFESETDDYPLDEVRDTYERTYLEKLDRELLEYSNRMRVNILNACQRIVAEYS
jgi:hypothetical protein